MGDQFYWIEYEALFIDELINSDLDEIIHNLSKLTLHINCIFYYFFDGTF